MQLKTRPLLYNFANVPVVKKEPLAMFHPQTTNRSSLDLVEFQGGIVEGWTSGHYVLLYLHPSVRSAKVTRVGGVFNIGYLLC